MSSVANISAGDKIRLDIDSVGHGIETVTVTKVGTASVRNTFNGPLQATEDPGTGLDLAAPLKFNHASNMPFSVRGTGISFTPATAFAHSSNEPVQPLGTGITLDKPLAKAHAIDAVVRDAAVTTAGYQGTPAPNQWFGGPALSASAGTMVLRDAAGLVVDSLNYGLLVDPWASEGYHGKSGAGEGGCRVPSPGLGRQGLRTARSGCSGRHHAPSERGPLPGRHRHRQQLQRLPGAARHHPVGRIGRRCDQYQGRQRGGLWRRPDGHDRHGREPRDRRHRDGWHRGRHDVAHGHQAGRDRDPGGLAFGFRAGQDITIDSGANEETAVVASISGFGRGNATITVTAPLKMAHDAGAVLAGTGLTFANPLTKAHASGTQVGTHLPTPGAPNQYVRAR